MRPLRSVVFARVSMTGVILAGLFAWLSLTPSLLPRSWLYQAAVFTFSAVFGYGLGLAVAGMTTRLGGWKLRPKRDQTWIVLGVVVAVLTILAFVYWPRWQDEQRALVELAPRGGGKVALFLGAGMALTVVLVFLGRLLRWLIGKLAVFLDRFLPRWAAYGLAVAVLVAGAYVLTIDVVWNGFIGWANQRYAAADQATAEGDEPPVSPMRSGSPDSLIAWETLGEKGRAFVAGEAPLEDMAGFAGGEVEDPIRLYAGLASVPDNDGRAELLLREMDRTGAWDRDLVIVWSTTGTGFVDPDAVEAVEYMHRGDTAIVAMQYSYLPSWISFMVDQSKAADASKALVEAVLGRWSTMPEAERPALVLFGESLGSFGTEAAIGQDSLESSIASAERTDGVVLMGPTDRNVLWLELIDARAAQSPSWRPRSDLQPEVLVGNRPGELSPMPIDLEVGRISYYHHPSDPIGYWNWETLWRPQRWSERPIGYDVSPNVDWYPWVSFWQVVFDLVAGFSAGPGYGHNYSVDMPDIWASVAAPARWTQSDSDRLRTHLAATGEAIAG